MKLSPYSIINRYPFGIWVVTYFMLSLLIGDNASKFDESQSSMARELGALIDMFVDHIPKIEATAQSYTQFPRQAMLVLFIFWTTFPVQLAVMYGIIGRPGIWYDYYVELNEYPIRGPLFAAVAVAITLILIVNDNAASNAGLLGPRAGVFASMPDAVMNFTMGMAFMFFALAMFGALLLRQAIRLLTKALFFLRKQ